MSEFKTSPKAKNATISTVPDGEATPIVKGSHVYLDRRLGLHLPRLPRAAAPDAALRRPARRRRARLLRHAVEALARDARRPRRRPTSPSSSMPAARPSATRSTTTTRRNRPPPPEELVPQFPLIRDAVKAFNVACIEQDGYEADDLIATYAREVVDAGGDVTIVSSDKDLMQLVRPGVVMLDAMKAKKHRPRRGDREVRRAAREGRRRAVAGRRLRPTTCRACRASASRRRPS